MRRTRRTTLAVAIATLIAILPSSQAAAQQCLVPNDQLINPGIGRDAIPALTNPKVVTAEQATFIQPTAWVLGVVIDGIARAYPLQVFWWHEIINDFLGETPVAVTFCPLTGSGLVYDPMIDGKHVTFGTSGLLFDNNLVMYDRTSESLWTQMSVLGICGTYKGYEPQLVPVVQMTWAGWKALHPDTTIVSFDTGFDRNYNQYPYGNYAAVDNPQLLYPLSFFDPRLPPKALVHGIEHEGLARAYSINLLIAEDERGAVNDNVNGLNVLLVYDLDTVMMRSFDRRPLVQKKSGKWKRRKLRFSIVEDDDGFPFMLRDKQTKTLWNLRGEPVEGKLVGKVAGGALVPLADAYTAYWFAWAAFQRDSDIYGR